MIYEEPLCGTVSLLILLGRGFRSTELLDACGVVRPLSFKGLGMVKVGAHPCVVSIRDSRLDR
jgi:hypothetical protein